MYIVTILLLRDFKELINILSVYTEHMYNQKRELFESYSLQYITFAYKCPCQGCSAAVHCYGSLSLYRTDVPCRMSKPYVYFLRHFLSRRSLRFNLRLRCAKLVDTANARAQCAKCFPFYQPSHHRHHAIWHTDTIKKKGNISWITREHSFTFRFSSFPTTQSLIFKNSFVLTFTSLIHVHFVVSEAFVNTNQCTILRPMYVFDTNPLLLHISHFSRSVRSQNMIDTTSQKCTDRTHVLTSERRLAEWFTKGRARHT
jgi:hypothetical protein